METDLSTGACHHLQYQISLQYSCLENPMDGGAWWATVHVVEKSRIRLRDFTSPLNFIKTGNP